MKVALRNKGFPQGAVLEDQGRMTPILNLVDKLRAAYHSKSIIADLEDTPGSAKNRTIQELGNIFKKRNQEVFRTQKHFWLKNKLKSSLSQSKRN